MTEGKPFRMPSDQPGDQPGPQCIFCKTPLNGVYRTLHKDRFTFREHYCPKCGRKNTTMQMTIERVG